MSLTLEHHKLFSHWDRVHAWLQGEAVIPPTVEVSPSSACNHRCLMCGYDHLGHRRGIMDPALLQSICQDVAAAGVRGLVFAGDGEPFANRGLLPAMAASRAAGADVAVSTNGALIRDQDLPLLAELLTWIRFSVNGTEDEEYARVHGCDRRVFGEVWRRIEGLVAAKRRLASPVTIGVQMVLLPENIAGAARLAARAREAGVDYFVMKPFLHNPKNAYAAGVDYQAHAATLEAATTLATTGFTSQMRWDTVRCQPRGYRQCLAWPFLLYVRTDAALMPCLARQEEDRLSLGNLATGGFAALCRQARQGGVATAMAAIDVATCQPSCRHHSMNNALWQMLHPGPHRSFV
ncbi:MAG: radical SAM protein [Thermodesulfobacteriota bacterium]